MKRNVIIALTVTVAAAIAFSTMTNDPPPIEIGSSKEEPGSSSVEISMVEISNEASSKDTAAVRIDDIYSRPMQEELAETDQSVEANFASALTVESQDFIQAVVYESVSSPAISSVAYLDQIDCSDSGCDIELKFYDTLPIHRRTASLMSDMNARLEENPATKHLQFGLRLIRVGDDGIGEVIFLIMPRQEKKFTLIIAEDLLSR